MKSRIKDMVLVSLFTALIAVGAMIRIPLPYFDYITLQTLFVLLSGMILGGKLGAAAVVVYILLGLCGVPVFAGGGGIDYIFRPGFGYIIGFAVATGLVGVYIERGNTKPSPVFSVFLIAGFIGIFVIYLFGIIYRYLILNLYMDMDVPMRAILITCFTLEIPKDILVCIFAARLAKRIKRARMPS